MPAGQSRFRLGALGSIAMIAIALTTLVYAGRLLLFTVDLQGLETPGLDKAAASPAQAAQAAERFGEWQHVYGFSGMATRSLALDPEVPMSVGQRLQLDVAALSENPSDGLLWLAYARSVAQSGIDFKNVREAVDVSRLVGRREQVVMVDRILFTLSDWARFPPDEQAAALREMHDIRWFLRPAERAAIETAVSSNTGADHEALKQSVAAALAN